MTGPDAVLRPPGESTGADADVALAVRWGLPIYYCLDDIPPRAAVREQSSVVDERPADDPPIPLLRGSASAAARRHLEPARLPTTYPEDSL